MGSPRSGARGAGALAYERKDAFYRKAKAEGQRSRAVYKLDELQKRFRLMKHGDAVVDVGAWPGAWSEYAAEKVGPKGIVVGFDLVEVEPLPAQNVVLLQGDVTRPEDQERIREALGRPADCVLSDASPKLSGIRDADVARVHALAEQILDFAGTILKPGGNFAIKLFTQATAHELIARCKQGFRKVKITRPEATRKGSSEHYLVAIGFKGAEGR